MSDNNEFQERRRFNSKEWVLIDKLLTAGLKEQKKARWMNFIFKFAMLAYLATTLYIFSAPYHEGRRGTDVPHVAVVDLIGPIAADEDASADSIDKALTDAFESETAQGVILRINSPGGSPVQSGILYREIMRLREAHPDKRLYAVITDSGASGAYYIAAAAEEIYADPASLVGSIGVISDGFGFADAIKRFGVERRVFTAGENKAMLDSFSPINAEQAQFFEGILTDIHQQFIDAVKQGRGERLKESPEIFSGLVWSGRQALELGLVDGLASPAQVAREKFETTEIVNYSPKRSPFASLADKLGASIAENLLSKTLSGGFTIR